MIGGELRRQTSTDLPNILLDKSLIYVSIPSVVEHMMHGGGVKRRFIFKSFALL